MWIVKPMIQGKVMRPVNKWKRMVTLSKVKVKQALKQRAEKLKSRKNKKNLESSEHRSLKRRRRRTQ